MTTELTITTERIDDCVLLIQVMMKMNLPAILDKHLPRHWLQQGLSWGWVTTIWLAHILSQGDHRKLTVRDWVAQASVSLEKTTGFKIRDTDFTDDRLTLVLRELSKPDYWQAIERDLGQATICAYELDQEVAHVDATTVSGYHTVTGEGLFQFGRSKDNTDLPQIKVMQGVLGPLGLPLVTHGVSGERADDGLYVPVLEAMGATLTKTAGVLFVGDCKMSALATRAYLHTHHHYYLTPLALVGKTAEQVQAWIQAGQAGQAPLTPVWKTEGTHPPVLIGHGYETTRACSTESETGQHQVNWTERILVVRSDRYGQALSQGLDKRLATATAKLAALTPARGRGKRQITEEAELVAAAQAILAAHQVDGLLHYTFERQEEQRVTAVGRGRGAQQRPQRVTKRVRYQITSVVRDELAIDRLKQSLGWRVYATNAPATRLTLETAVLTYREEWVVERDFHRLKGAPLSLDPLFVKRDDQVQGLTHLLSLAVRLLTLIEFVVRRALSRTGETLVGLHKENLNKATATPTTERLLKAFSNITLTILHLPDRVIYHVTPLSELQRRILELVDLSPAVYQSLAENST